jgi:hypothetical protein
MLTASNIRNRNRTATLTRCSVRTWRCAQRKALQRAAKGNEKQAKASRWSAEPRQPLRSHMGALRHQRSSVLLPCAKNLSFHAIIATTCQSLPCGSSAIHRNPLRLACPPAGRTIYGASVRAVAEKPLHGGTGSFVERWIARLIEWFLAPSRANSDECR